MRTRWQKTYGLVEVGVERSSIALSERIHCRRRGIIIPVKAPSKTDLYRKLPSVDDLLRGPELAAITSPAKARAL